MSEKLNKAGFQHAWTRIKNYIDTLLGTKQNTLVSGTNIKTINGNSVLGSGNLTISGLQNLVDGSATGSVRGINTYIDDETYTIGEGAFATGGGTKAGGAYSHAEGGSTTASGSGSHAEGSSTTASGEIAHAEGIDTTASGDYSHAEGNTTTASGQSSHAEGKWTEASGEASHAEGKSNHATKEGSHAEGYMTTASGNHSHAQNYSTIASKSSQTALGTFNIEDTSTTTTHPMGTVLYGQYAVIVGNGIASNRRSNALAVGWDGNVYIALDTSATSGVDKEIYDALVALGWDSDCIV